MQKEMCTNTGCSVTNWIMGLLLIIGGLNWGLLGLFNFDLVAALFGPMTFASKTIYTVVGIAAVYWIIQCCFRCKKPA